MTLLLKYNSWCILGRFALYCVLQFSLQSEKCVCRSCAS